MRLALAIVVCFMLSGCGMVNDLKHLQSDWVGLNRTVTLYSASGEPINSWSGRFKVEDNGGSISFVDNGKTIKVAGTYTVIAQVEKQKGEIERLMGDISVLYGQQHKHLSQLATQTERVKRLEELVLQQQVELDLYKCGQQALNQDSLGDGGEG